MSRRQVVYQEMDSPNGVSRPRSIAILPFHNATDTPGLGQMVRQSLYDHLSHRRFKDVELTVVDQALNDPGGIPVDPLTPDVLRNLGERLGCDAVVTGRVTELERLFMGVYSQLSVGADITIHDTHDGRRLWSDSHVARLHDGGLPLTPLGLPLSGVRSGWNLRDSQIIRAVDELTRALADRIPEPDTPMAVASAVRFELQVGAYLDHELAVDQRDELEAKGFPAAVYSEMQQETIWHRVMVGPYPDEREALRVRQQLEDQLGIRPFLRRQPL
ncbi:MAG: SPOR domain-containing protein [Deltaproteobacteria bacterium]|nr:SPOR domain-containing protein [Deltaproteobacteria bacterium]